jgi:phosphomevalonate kinase
MRVIASAPGKLVLLGEYAVLEGAPALVLAVDRRASVALESRESPHNPATRHPGDIRDGARNQRFPGGDELWEIVAPTLQLQAQLRLQDGRARWVDAAPPELEWIANLLARFPQARDLPPCRIELDSDAFYLDHAGTREKLGLGSSAALTVALLGALRAQGHAAAPTIDQAIEAHRAIQHGHGSGIDIAASLMGGLSRFRLEGDATRVATIALPKDLRWVCVYSGHPASTRTMLATVAAWREREPTAFTQYMHELATISSRGIDALTASDAAIFLSSLHDYATVLARFGTAASVDIASREHRAIAAIAGDCGCVYKSCGAGGGDIGITFAVEDSRLREFSKRASRAGYPVIGLEADPKGLEVVSNI